MILTTHIRIDQLRRSAGLKQIVEIRGDEPWLATARGNFPRGFAAPISGELELKLSGDDQVRVIGVVRAEPYVACGRCDDAIVWPIEEKIDAVFVRDVDRNDEELENFEDLSVLQAETYQLSPRGEVDLEQVINDSLQLALPFKLVRTDIDAAGREICLVCHEPFLD